MTVRELMCPPDKKSTIKPGIHHSLEAREPIRSPLHSVDEHNGGRNQLIEFYYDEKVRSTGDTLCVIIEVSHRVLRRGL